MNFRLIILLSFYLCSIELIAQKPVLDNSIDNFFYTGLELYESAQYLSAAQQFDQYLDHGQDAGLLTKSIYYRACIQLVYRHQESGLEDFIKSHDGDPLNQNAYLMLGDYFFDALKYADAISYYKHIQNGALLVSQFAKVRYRLAYSYYKSENLDKALTLFKEAAHYQESESSKANYYAGVILFDSGLIDEAQNHFLLAEKSPELIAFTAPYITKIYFSQKNYENVISYVQNSIEFAGISDQIILNRLAGEAYFALKKYRNAIDHLNKSLSLNQNKSDEMLYYKLGYSNKQMGNRDNAIENYKVAALSDSETGQLSAFKLGELYLDNNEFIYAISAFEAASKAEYNSQITEQAYFLHAKSLFRLGQYEQSIFAFDNFLKKYKTSIWFSEASDLLARSYLNTTNYDAAIKYLEAERLNSKIKQQTYQMVTFRKAQLLYNNNLFIQSINYLEKSLKYKSDQLVTNHSNYLMGECLSSTNKYLESIPFYLKVLRDSKQSSQTYIESTYSLGYAYYNTQKYQESITAFDKFLISSSKNHSFRFDAKTRKADCLYVLKDYTSAIAVYTELISAPNGDYVKYQLGIIYYLTGDLHNSEKYFKQVVKDHSNSYYCDNASYQLGELYADFELFEKSDKQFSDFINKFPESKLLPYAYLGRGLTRSNLNNFSMAQSDFDFIMDKYILHESANNALLGLQDLVSKGYEIENFNSYIEKLRAVDPNNKNLESVSFEQVKTYYFNQDYQKVIEATTNYISTYSKNQFTDEAMYYRADSYFRLGKWRKTIDEFKPLSGKSDNTYSSRIYSKIGDSYMNLSQFDSAKISYSNLLNFAGNNKDKYKAQEGLMIAYFLLGDYENSKKFADEILNDSWKPLNAENISWLYKGKAEIKEGHYEEAIETLKNIIKNSNDEKGAEANYLIGWIQFKQTLYQNSIETSFEVISKFGSYPKWTDEAYLLLVENYLALNELLQAKATLNSIIEKSDNKILKEKARLKIVEIQTLEEKVLTIHPNDTTGQ